MRYITLFIILNLSLHASSAQDSTVCITLKSLEEAHQLALNNNADYEIYSLRIQQAEMDVKAAKSYLWPTITGTISGQENLTLATTPLPGEIFGQPGETINAQFGQPYTYNAGISASKSLLDWRSSLQAKAAENEVSMEWANQEAFKQQLLHQVSFYYYATLIAQEAERLNQKNIEVADSILLLTVQKREQGLVNQSIYNHAKIVLNNAKQNLNNTEGILYDYYLQFKLLLGLSLEDSLTLEGVIEVNPVEVVNVSLVEDKALLVSQLQVDQADIGVKLRQSAFAPKLSLNAYFGQQQFREDFGLSFDSNDWSGFSYIGLNLSIPIFTGFANNNNLKSARIEQQIAEQKWLSDKQKSNVQDEVLMEHFSSSREQVALSYDNFKLYQSNNELTFQKYEQGLIGLYEYLVAFDDLIKAENAYLNALTNFYNYYSTIISRQDR